MDPEVGGEGTSFDRLTGVCRLVLYCTIALSERVSERERERVCVCVCVFVCV